MAGATSPISGLALVIAAADGDDIVAGTCWPGIAVSLAVRCFSASDLMRLITLSPLDGAQ
jgi:hypothetical protein